MKRQEPILLISQDTELLGKIRQIPDPRGNFFLIFHSPEPDTVISLIAEQKIRLAAVDIDTDTSSRTGLDLARDIRLKTPAEILLVSRPAGREEIISAIRFCFASGYLFKDQLSQIGYTIRSILPEHTAQKYIMQELILSVLTPAEKSVLSALLDQSFELKSSPKTLANQKTSILHKLHLKNTRELLHIFRHY